MPQMNPMSWMLLYMYFILMTTMFIVKIYFNKKMTKQPQNQKHNKQIEKIWMW
nr:ATP synthase F0 subunit 8 [Phryganistria guangxiensis]